MAGAALGQEPAMACESQLYAWGGLDLPGMWLQSPHLEQLRTQRFVLEEALSRAARPIPRDSASGPQEAYLLGLTWPWTIRTT